MYIFIHIFYLTLDCNHNLWRIQQAYLIQNIRDWWQIA